MRALSILAPLALAACGARPQPTEPHEETEQGKLDGPDEVDADEPLTREQIDDALLLRTGPFLLDELPADLAALVAAPGAPSVIFYELANRVPPQFMGYAIEASSVLSADDGKRVLTLLADPHGFITSGQPSCADDPVGFRIQRAEHQLDVVIDCGVVSLPGKPNALLMTKPLFGAFRELREAFGVDAAGYPQHPPVVAATRSGGHRGGDYAVKVWDDGTVQFRGRLCSAGRPGKVSREDVRRLVKVLADVLLDGDPRAFQCSQLQHAASWYVELRAGKRTRTIRGIDPFLAYQCPWVVDTVHAIREVVGDNPCE